MPAPAIAVTADQIDAEWMTQALRASGALPTGRVVAIDAKRARDKAEHRREVACERLVRWQDSSRGGVLRRR